MAHHTDNQPEPTTEHRQHNVELIRNAVTNGDTETVAVFTTAAVVGIVGAVAALAAFVGGLVIAVNPDGIIRTVAATIGATILFALTLKVEIVIRGHQRIVAELFSAVVYIAVAVAAGNIYIWLLLAASYAMWLYARMSLKTVGYKR